MLDYQVVRGLSYGPPWAHYLGGYQNDYSVGPLDYPRWAARHLLAWSTRILAKKYSNRRLYMTGYM
jgi:hypothetical protein